MDAVRFSPSSYSTMRMGTSRPSRSLTCAHVVLTFCTLSPIFISLFCVSAVFAQQNGRQDENWPPGWTERCLGCICEAASNCNETIGCIGEYCGMFLISRGYWVDAGRPILIDDDPDRPEAFNNCVLEPYCAARTVNQYIHRFIQDCNNDGSLTCDDYARLHYLGNKQCTRSLRTVPYYRQFLRCFRSNPNADTE